MVETNIISKFDILKFAKDILNEVDKLRAFDNTNIDTDTLKFNNTYL